MTGGTLRTVVAALAVACAALPVHEAAAAAANKPVKKSAQKYVPKPVAKEVRKVKPASRTPRKAVAPVVEAVAKPTFGQLYGLHAAADPLDLKSSVALVMDQDTNEVLFAKNSQAVLPIASITKLMTALVVVEAGQSLDEKLTISDEDIDTEKGTRSRLAVGTTLTRGEMMHLALMSSENRAANALGRHYPGGLDVFVAAMNQKAQALGMRDTHYVEPTGLSSRNQSSANDLAALVKVAHEVPLLRELSTSREHQVALGRRQVQFHSTNGLLSSKSWDIGLQKTGFINEAGRCLVMQARMAGRKVIMVLLDSTGKYSRIGDAERVRKWVLSNPAALAQPLKAVL
ncbi:D-alanyl-D-alanine endopeptidase [Paucibacter sp. TC2R-5]|uniref:D-alanyl-D-alanine endopeptidase n=1 Tax=Paucibacter sp. TC2R-5 TaxID=2893555 RepID=UPI0021E3FD07|nr:D-alanyl-D-alanine endopeptidase [Paucibacter sp. TC2R-5]MCV2359281.1 D-alanyl-D-alanine endopeptidase [Paucibacter sp. TC2R-5]